MRLGVVVMLAFLFGSACRAEPVAVYTPDKADGLDIVTVADGQWEYKMVGGRKCVRLKQDTQPASLYMYFRMDPAIRSVLGSDVWLAIDFYDSPVGIVGTHFNTDANPYAAAPGFLLLDTKKWERTLVHLSNAKLAGLQNDGADFRFMYPGLAISRIEVYDSKPDLKIPSDKERVMSNSSHSPRPKGMFYTFGNDADESSAALYRSLGVTSIESYVTWETCERDGEGKWDWTQWDKQVQILKDNDLKWVPFIILGPAYSTPNWFRASKDHVPCRCLEHEIDSKVESRWNPNLPKYIDRFLSEFAKRYGKSGVIESVLLGIQGDFGEAIYSVTGGGWTFNVPGEYHNHAGYWCADKYALESFRKYAEAKYGSADAINKAWGTSFTSIAKVDFPGHQDDLTAFEARLAKDDAGNPQVRRRWLDFIDWYRAEMTDWSDWWIETTRKYFPKTPIYLCTGGDAEPRHGSNFAEQCRVAAKHDAGVRITNEASNYANNFVITRWVASAGKQYGAYYGFEPAGAEDEKGIVARIYNATASGANQLHDYNPNVVTSQSRLDAQRANIKWLYHVPKPIVPVALWYPNVDMTLKWGGYFGQAMMLRDLVDYDYVDETMLRNGGMATHKLLVILHGAVMEKDDANLLAEWIRQGGRAIVMGVDKFESVEGTSEPETLLFGDTPAGRSLGKGEIARVRNEDELASRITRDLRELGLSIANVRKDGIFATETEPGKFLFLNTGPASAKVKIECEGKTIEPRVAGGAITEVTAD